MIATGILTVSVNVIITITVTAITTVAVLLQFTGKTLKIHSIAMPSMHSILAGIQCYEFYQDDDVFKI